MKGRSMEQFAHALDDGENEYREANMTEGHKHHLLTVPSWDAWPVRVLRWALLHSTDLQRVEASPYPWGECPKREGPCMGHRDCWTLSTLSILHRWTGLTLLVKEEPDPGSLEAGRRLASERDDLIAKGVDPADLIVPLAPFPETPDDHDG